MKHMTQVEINARVTFSCPIAAECLACPERQPHEVSLQGQLVADPLFERTWSNTLECSHPESSSRAIRGPIGTFQEAQGFVGDSLHGAWPDQPPV